MNKINEALGLKPDATEAESLAAIAKLQADAATRATGDKLQKQIDAKIVASGGALNRDQAILAINEQAAHDARVKAAK